MYSCLPCFILLIYTRKYRLLFYMYQIKRGYFWTFCVILYCNEVVNGSLKLLIEVSFCK